jgi:hypothetical protein
LTVVSAIHITNNNNTNGIFVSGGNTTGASLNVTIVDSEASNDGDFGIEAISSSGHAPTAVMLCNVVASNNGIGLDADGAILRVAHSVVTGNASAVNVEAGGTLFTYGDNDIDGNTNNNTGVLTSLAMH